MKDSQRSSARRIGLTSTIPVEVVFAAGAIPVDLNNLFINSGHARKMVEDAERMGFPQNSCAWVKGLYTAARENGITEVIGVAEGDCSQNCALMDIWRNEDVTVHTFSYSPHFNKQKFTANLQELCDEIGAEYSGLEDWKYELDRTRAIANEIDTLAWGKRCVDSDTLFEAQLNLSDFFGNPDDCHSQLLQMLDQVKQANPAKEKVPLAVAGVPTIISDLWPTIENSGGRVIYHEVPHQFSLGRGVGKSLADTFEHYTYGATAAIRMREICAQLSKRGVRGLIHYVQSFCHRQIHDIILRREVDIPVLTIEADRPGETDGRTLTRIEAFLEQLAN